MHQLLVSRIGRRYAGWITGELAEIMAMPRVFRLPQPMPHLAGTAVLRGRLLTVVDTFSLMGEKPEPLAGGLLLRLASPLGHLALAIPSIEAVIPYQGLNLREEEAEGIWAGLYPWEDVWVNVVKPHAVAAQLGQSLASAVRFQATGREHAP